MTVQNLGTIRYGYTLRIVIEVCVGFYMGKFTFFCIYLQDIKIILKVGM